MRPPNPLHLLPHPHALTLLSTLHLLTTALTLPPPPHNNSSSPTPHPITAQTPNCVTNFDWTFPPFSAHDCTLTARPIAHLAALYSTHPIEFSAPGRPARTSHPRFYLPARWDTGSCVVAIAMLELYPPRALPGRVRSPEVDTDVGDWRGIFEALVRVEACVVSSERVGWEAVGVEGGVGVFVWARASVIDEFTRLRVGEGRLPEWGNGTLGGVQA